MNLVIPKKDKLKVLPLKWTEALRGHRAGTAWLAPWFAFGKLGAIRKGDQQPPGLYGQEHSHGKSFPPSASHLFHHIWSTCLALVPRNSRETLARWSHFSKESQRWSRLEHGPW